MQKRHPRYIVTKSTWRWHWWWCDTDDDDNDDNAVWIAENISIENALLHNMIIYPYQQ